MNKSGICLCLIVVFLTFILNTLSLNSSQWTAEWLIIIFAFVIALLLMFSSQRNTLYAGSLLFFSIAILNLILLYVLTQRIGTFLLGTTASLLVLVPLLFFSPRKTSSSKRTESSYNPLSNSSSMSSSYLTSSHFSSNTSSEPVKDLGLPQMLDNIPQNDPLVEVELETYEEPVIALGNEKVRRAKRVTASPVSSRKTRGRRKAKRR